MRQRTLIGLAVIAAMMGGSGAATAPRPKTFPSADAAVKAMVDALRAEDKATLMTIFGAQDDGFLDSGDSVQDKSLWAKFVAAYDEKHALEASTPKRSILVVGKRDWPFPIPIISTTGGWSFDPVEGREEIINRRVGSNELSTIQTCLAVTDAQYEYYHVDHDGDGILEYASRFISTPGKKDGLYWQTASGEPPSPLGDLVEAANLEHYSTTSPDEPRPYHGYYFKMLTAQGKNASGGAYDYMVRGNLMGGFAVISCPATYGVTGVMTFIVNHDGVIYQKDLGENTLAIAKKITSFDPDPSWVKVPQKDLIPLADGP